MTPLIPLARDSCAILRAAVGASLKEGAARVIQMLGGHVVDELPEFVREHAGVVGPYVRVPMPEDIVEVRYGDRLSKERR